MKQKPKDLQGQLDLFSPGKETVPSFYQFEYEARQRGYRQIAGVDEAGRGPLAGPVVVAACLLPFGLEIEGVDDSKKLSASKRESLFDTLLSHPQILYSIEVIEPEVIDKINILQATLLGMKQAILKLSLQPDYVLIDGSQLPPSLPMPARAIVKGDSLSFSIACASILAKVARDTIMLNYDKAWPEYGFAKHKGYPTEEHMQSLRIYGPSPIHRKSFSPVKELCEMRQN